VVTIETEEPSDETEDVTLAVEVEVLEPEIEEL